jgi:hypothetical protein
MNYKFINGKDFSKSSKSSKFALINFDKKLPKTDRKKQA